MIGFVPIVLIVLTGGLVPLWASPGAGQVPVPKEVTVMAALDEKMGGLEGSWLVTDVADAELPPDAEIRIRFGDGRVWGRAACRSFSGSIDVSGDGYFLGELKRGHEECAPELMEAEDQFMRAFEVTNRFVIAKDGTLQLFALDFPKVTARPETAP